MRLHVCGVRGSTPSPGAEFARYGGHTSCVAVAHDGEWPSLVLDAGTGLRRLTHLLGEAPFQGSLLLGHLHWDHTQGLPFFGAGDHPDARVTLHMPEQGDPLAVLSRSMSPPHFPIEPTGLRGDWRFVGLEAGHHVIEGFDVLALDIPHRGGRTFGYRLSDERSAVAYLSDHGPAQIDPGPDGWGPYHEAAMELAAGVDLLIHDAQHTGSELLPIVHHGHSAADYAVRLGELAGARHVLLFHHDPSRTDIEVDAIVATFAGRAIEVTAATEGTTFGLP